MLDEALAELAKENEPISEWEFAQLRSEETKANHYLFAANANVMFFQATP